MAKENVVGGGTGPGKRVSNTPKGVSNTPNGVSNTLESVFNTPHANGVSSSNGGGKARAGTASMAPSAGRQALQARGGPEFDHQFDHQIRPVPSREASWETRAPMPKMALMSGRERPASDGARGGTLPDSFGGGTLPDGFGGGTRVHVSGYVGWERVEVTRPSSGDPCEDRILDRPALGEKGSKGRWSEETVYI